MKTFAFQTRISNYPKKSELFLFFNILILSFAILKSWYGRANEIKADMSKGIINHFPVGASICEIKPWSSDLIQPLKYQSNYSPFCLEGERFDRMKFSALINAMKIHPLTSYHLVISALHFGTNVNVLYFPPLKKVMIQPTIVTNSSTTMKCIDRDLDEVEIRHESPTFFALKFLNETFQEEEIVVREGMACFFDLYFFS